MIIIKNGILWRLYAWGQKDGSQAKVLAIKSDNLSLMPGTQSVDGEGVP